MSDYSEIPTAWKIVKCSCGHPSCEYYGTSNGSFPQGAGYNLEDAELIASAPRLKCERDELAECVNELYDALVNLESAARGMPNSHDDLCQGTLNLACEEARNIIAKVEK